LGSREVNARSNSNPIPSKPIKCTTGPRFLLGEAHAPQDTQTVHVVLFLSVPSHTTREAGGVTQLLLGPSRPTHFDHLWSMLEESMASIPPTRDADVDAGIMQASRS